MNMTEDLKYGAVDDAEDDALGDALVENANDLGVPTFVPLFDCLNTNLIGMQSHNERYRL